jgi:3-methyladenine DNA glycosylase AlkD
MSPAYRQRMVRDRRRDESAREALERRGTVVAGMVSAARKTAAATPARGDVDEDVRRALAWLERRGSKRNRDGMARYGIVATKAFGVSMATMQTLAKQLGRDQALARALWRSGWYEARMLVAFVGDPARLTAAEMDRWCRDFDNWAICDTLCFHLFDKTPHAWGKVGQWARRAPEFEKRAAFALLAALALHDRTTPEARFRTSLRLIAPAATDPRNFVKKGVSWALRSIGHRSLTLHTAASGLAAELARGDDPTARWVGKDALRDLSRTAVRQRLERRK